MDPAAVENLVCPTSQQPLILEGVECQDGKVLEGSLYPESGPRAGEYRIHRGIPDFVPPETEQSQTVQSFAHKWGGQTDYRTKTERFYTNWYLDRYGFQDERAIRRWLSGTRRILDAGAGAGRDAVNFLKWSTADVYAVDTARVALERLAEEVTDPRLKAVRADVDQLPFRDSWFDLINCDQVIHHLPDPRATLERFARKLAPGGRLCCYVYRRKGPIREFTDDHVRKSLQSVTPDEAMEACVALTRLGESLAKANVTIEIPEDVPVLGLSKGRLDLQRFFHWHVFKCFWNPEFDFRTNNLVNFDWYHPELCHRFSPEEFRDWFSEGWDIESWDEREAGISCRARKI